MQKPRETHSIKYSPSGMMYIFAIIDQSATCVLVLLGSSTGSSCGVQAFVIILEGMVQIVSFDLCIMIGGLCKHNVRDSRVDKGTHGLSCCTVLC